MFSGAVAIGAQDPKQSNLIARAVWGLKTLVIESGDVYVYVKLYPWTTGKKLYRLNTLGPSFSSNIPYFVNFRIREVYPSTLTLVHPENSYNYGFVIFWNPFEPATPKYLPFMTTLTPNPNGDGEAEFVPEDPDAEMVSHITVVMRTSPPGGRSTMFGKMFDTDTDRVIEVLAQVPFSDVTYYTARELDSSTLLPVHGNLSNVTFKVTNAVSFLTTTAQPAEEQHHML
jgi:hypothetical protein